MRLLDDGALTLEWVSPVGEQTCDGAAPPVGRNAGRLARSLGWRRRWGRKQNGARVCGEPAAGRFCSHENRSPPSIADERLTTFWAECGPGGRWVSRPRPSLRFEFSRRLERVVFWLFGPNVAQAGDEFRGPGLRHVFYFSRGLERTVFLFLGRNLVRILSFFLYFSFSRKIEWLKNCPKLSIIKKISMVKF
jgi:hypothetical protein